MPRVLKRRENVKTLLAIQRKEKAAPLPPLVFIIRVLWSELSAYFREVHWSKTGESIKHISGSHSFDFYEHRECKSVRVKMAASGLTNNTTL